MDKWLPTCSIILIILFIFLPEVSMAKRSFFLCPNIWGNIICTWICKLRYFMPNGTWLTSLNTGKLDHSFTIRIVNSTFIDRIPGHIFTSCCKAFKQWCARQCVSITFASYTCTPCCASTCCEFVLLVKAWLSISLKRRFSLYLLPVLSGRSEHTVGYDYNV